MNFLGRFSIRTRVYFGTVFSLILLVVIGAMVYVALDRTRGTLQELFAERVQTLTDMSELRHHPGWPAPDRKRHHHQFQEPC